jgi:Putative heavy-metal chelation
MLEKLRTLALQKSQDYPDDHFKIRGIWRMDYHCQPNQWERDLLCGIWIVQTLGQGCCYVDYKGGYLNEDLIGQDARYARPQHLWAEIALLDSVYSVFQSEPDSSFSFRGNTRDKATLRARFIAELVTLELQKIGGKKVVQIGVLGNLLQQCQEFGIDIVGTDFDPELIRNGINGVTVHHADQNNQRIQEADIVLVTGMTLATNTLQGIIDTAQRHGKKVMLFTATGAHFAEAYCNTFGIDVVFSETLPHYMFQGSSTINVFRRKTATL